MYRVGDAVDSQTVDESEKIETPAGNQPVELNPDRRNPWFALLLSLMVPGLGLMYIGRLRMAIFYYLLFAGVVTAVTQTRFIIEPVGFYVVLISFLLWYVLIVISSLVIGYRRRNTSLRGYQRWYGYTIFILFIALAQGVTLSMREEYLGYATYRLPGASMQPTIQAGEYILADTWVYNKREPERGEVVVFRYPQDPKILYIKRIIAEGGDLVAIRKGKLIINGKEIKETYLKDVAISLDYSLEMAERLVPKDQYFVMGDNRDYSNDSRAWGYLPVGNIHARAVYIWYSVDEHRAIQKKRLAKSIH